MLSLFSPLPYLFHSSLHQEIKKKNNDKDENEALTKQHEVFHVRIRSAGYHEYPALIRLDVRRDAGSRAEEIEVPTL